MHIPFLGAIASAVLLLAIAGAQAQPLTLNSGAVIEPLVSGPLISTKGWSAHVLEYRSQLSARDSVGLRLEADELWNRFINDTIRAGRDQALLMARTAESGNTPSPAGTTNFSYKKYGEMWRTSEWPETAPAMLDEAFVRSYMTRVAHAYLHRNPNTLLLYLAPEFSISIRQNGAAQSLSLPQFVQAFRGYIMPAKELRYERSVLNITIDPDGKSASIDSRVAETITINNKRIETVVRSTDRLEIRDNYAVLIKLDGDYESHRETILN